MEKRPPGQLQPTNLVRAREQKRCLSHFQIALGLEKSQWVWQAHSQIQGSLLLLGCAVFTGVGFGRI